MTKVIIMEQDLGRCGVGRESDHWGFHHAIGREWCMEMFTWGIHCYY